MVKKRLGIGKSQTYMLRDKQGNVITNRDQMVIVAEEFYRDSLTVATIMRILLNREVVQKRYTFLQ